MVKLTQFSFPTRNSDLVDVFVEQFEDMSLPAVMSDFSLPTPLGEHRDVLGMPQQQVRSLNFLIQLQTWNPHGNTY